MSYDSPQFTLTHVHSSAQLTTNHEIVDFNINLIVNSISIAATVSVLAAYGLFRDNYPLAMGRSTLVLSACIAVSDFVVHVFNIVGFGGSLSITACGVIGGFFFAVPLLCSTFYACSVAFNCLLVFVLHVPQTKALRWIYISGPPIASILIGIAALASGSYGWDDRYNYCWYSTKGMSSHQLLWRILWTWALPLFVSFCFLIVSITFIAASLFIPRIPTEKTLTSLEASTVNSIDTACDPDPTRRTNARRSLLFHLLAYIVIPLICVLPTPIVDIYTSTGFSIPHWLNLATDVLPSLIGLLNAIVYFADPTVLAIFRMSVKGGWKKFLRPTPPGSTTEQEIKSPKIDDSSLQGHLVIFVHIEKLQSVVDTVFARDIMDL